MPGMTTPISGATRNSWSRSALSAASAPGVLQLDGDLAAVPPDPAVHLPDAGRGRGGVVEVAEPAAPPGAELLGHHPVHGRGRHRRRRVLQLGQRLAVRRRVLVRDRGLVDAQRLAELHRAALERAEHLEELLGRAALHRGRDLVAVPPTSRWPSPSVARPAADSGRLASLAVRLRALRGMSATRPL